MSAFSDDKREDPYDPADLCPRWKDPDHDSVGCPACNGLEPDWIHDEPAATEQDDIIETFAELLRGPTSDGGDKRAAGTKPYWKVDPSHEAAAFRHIARWRDGERVDADSSCHPLVHAAWRLLAIAFQEQHEGVPPHPRHDYGPPTVDPRGAH